MGGIGRAAAVAEHKYLAVSFQRIAQHLNELRHSVHGDGIVGGLLGFDVFTDPLLHLAHSMDLINSLVSAKFVACRIDARGFKISPANFYFAPGLRLPGPY